MSQTSHIPDVDTVRAMAGQGHTDAQIAAALSVSAETIGHLRRKHGITAGYYQVPHPTGWGRRLRQSDRQLPQPLSPAELAVLQDRERDGLRNAPPKRGYCLDCEEWLLLVRGHLPRHTRKIHGVDRCRALICEQTIPYKPAGER